MTPRVAAGAASLYSAAAWAQPGAASAAGSLLQVLAGLVVVLALMAAAAWALKRLGVAKPAGPSTVRIVGGVSVGQRERIVVVEIAEQWLVVGVAPGHLSALSSLPRQPTPDPDSTPAEPSAMHPFAARLVRALEQRRRGH